MGFLGSFPRYTLIVQPALILSFRSEWPLHVLYIPISRRVFSWFICCVIISMLSDIPFPWQTHYLFYVKWHSAGSEGTAHGSCWFFPDFQYVDLIENPPSAWSGHDQVFKISDCCASHRTSARQAHGEKMSLEINWNFVKFDLGRWTVRERGVWHKLEVSKEPGVSSE